MVGKEEELIRHVLVDGIIVYFNPKSGNFHCEISSVQISSPKYLPTSVFLSDMWNYKNRAAKFISQPDFKDYLIAFLGLIRVAYVFRFFPFNQFLLWNEPPLKPKKLNSLKTLARRMTAAFGLLPLLPWRVMCLEVSALINHFGRNIGLSTKLFIGVRTAPFSSHAWCKLDGEVINDSPDVENHFVTIYSSDDAVS